MSRERGPDEANSGVGTDVDVGAGAGSRNCSLERKTDTLTFEYGTAKRSGKPKVSDWDRDDRRLARVEGEERQGHRLVWRRESRK